MNYLNKKHITCSRLARTSLASIIANPVPMQFLGPPPNGRYAPLGPIPLSARFQSPNSKAELSAFIQRSGINLLASSPHHLLSLSDSTPGDSALGI
eukprot:scaffold130336_cov49-Prasinocladus_malaysianus.AAC.1